MTGINIDDYLTEEEKVEIAREVFREQCVKRSQQDFERLITNSAYHVIWGAVEESFDGDLEEVLKKKVYQVIEDMDNFTVFRTPNAWDRMPNTPFQILFETVKDNKDLIDTKVKQAVGNLTKKDMKEVALKLVEQKML